MRVKVSFAVNEKERKEKKKPRIIIPFRTLLQLMVSSLCLLPDYILTWLAVVLAAAALNQLYELRLSRPPLSSKPQTPLGWGGASWILEVAPLNVCQIAASAWCVDPYFCTFAPALVFLIILAPALGGDGWRRLWLMASMPKTAVESINAPRFFCEPRMRQSSSGPSLSDTLLGP